MFATVRGLVLQAQKYLPGLAFLEGKDGAGVERIDNEACLPPGCDGGEQRRRGAW